VYSVIRDVFNSKIAMSANCYGLCCSSFSHISFRPGEPERIAEYLGISEEKFRELYCFTYPENWRYKVDGKQVYEGTIYQKPCPFHTTGLCAIEAVKPETCLNYMPACKAVSWPMRQQCKAHHWPKLTTPIEPYELIMGWQIRRWMMHRENHGKLRLKSIMDVKTWCAHCSHLAPYGVRFNESREDEKRLLGDVYVYCELDGESPMTGCGKWELGENQLDVIKRIKEDAKE